MGEPLSVVLYQAADRVRDAAQSVNTGNDLDVEWAGATLGEAAGQIYTGRDRHVAYVVTAHDLAWMVLTRPAIGKALEALLRDLGDAAAEHEAEPVDERDDPRDIYCHDEMLAAELAAALLRAGKVPEVT